MNEETATYASTFISEPKPWRPGELCFRDYNVDEFIAIKLKMPIGWFAALLQGGHSRYNLVVLKDLSYRHHRVLFMSLITPWLNNSFNIEVIVCFLAFILQSNRPVNFFFCNDGHVSKRIVEFIIGLSPSVT
jgi:hypothetical protein